MTPAAWASMSSAALLALAWPAAAQDTAEQRAGVEAGPERDEVGGPFQFSVMYTGDLWRNARGGRRRGGAYLDNLDVALEVDAERAFGWRGATILVSGLHNNDRRLSETLVGDLQVASNIDTYGATRLYEAWVQQQVAGGSLKAGVVDLNSEFDVNETRALFINSSHGVGPELSQVGQTGPSIFPITGLAVRVLGRPAPDWTVRLAAFDGAPGDPRRPRRTRLHLDGREGALLIGEIAHGRADGLRIALGGWRHTGEMKDFERRAPGGALATRGGSGGGYAVVETAPQPVGDRALRLFARAGAAEGRSHPVDRSLSAGAVLSGRLIGFEEEALGFAVSAARLGRAYRRAAELVGDTPARQEINIELTYRFRPTPWLVLQPDVQYVIDPGADRTLRNALAFGLRFELSAGFSR